MYRVVSETKDEPSQTSALEWPRARAHTQLDGTSGADAIMMHRKITVVIEKREKKNTYIQQH